MANSFEPLFPSAGDSVTPAASAPGWLAALGGQAGFVPDPRFSGAPDVPAASAQGESDAALLQAFAEGEQQGREMALAEMAETDRSRARLKLAFAGLDKAMQNQLSNRLAETVAALFEASFASLAIDRDALQRRCVDAAAMVGEGIIDASLRLHPADIDLLDSDFASTWHILPDADLERGTVEFVMTEGAVRDGPAEWRVAMREALGLC